MNSRRNSYQIHNQNISKTTMNDDSYELYVLQVNSSGKSFLFNLIEKLIFTTPSMLLHTSWNSNYVSVCTTSTALFFLFFRKSEVGSSQDVSFHVSPYYGQQLPTLYIYKIDAWLTLLYFSFLNVIERVSNTPPSSTIYALISFKRISKHFNLNQGKITYLYKCVITVSHSARIYFGTLFHDV